MEIKVKVHYPWADEPDWCKVQIPENISKSEIDKIAYEFVLDLLFDQGLSWDYEIIN